MRMGFDTLLIEDSDPLCQNIVDFLEPLGHRLHVANDGRSGLELALKQPFDLIILDIGIPKMDGLEMCRELRERAERQKRSFWMTATGQK